MGDVQELLQLQKDSIAMLSDSEVLFISIIDKKTGAGRVIQSKQMLEPTKSFDFDESMEQESLHVLPTDQKEFLENIRLKKINEKLKENEHYSVEAFMQMSDSGRFRKIAYHFSNSKNFPQYILSVTEDITETYIYDKVTGMKNFDGFRMDCLYEFSRFAPHQYVIINFNIVNFKAVNAIYGYKAGNWLLKKVLTTISEAEIPFCSVCRENADNYFCLCRKEDYDYDKLNQLCKMKISNDNGLSERLELFCGVYSICNDTESLDTIFDKARIARRQAEREIGVNSYVLDEVDKQRYLDEAVILSSISEAIQKGELIVYYQPIYNAKSGEMTSAEALVRWLHPEKGLIPPGVFIPAVERTGQIAEIDLYVAQHVQQFQKKRFLAGEKIIPISLNVSRYDFLQEKYLEHALVTMQEYPEISNMIRIEITESGLINIPSSGETFMHEMRSMGIQTMIDDFGTGYSSLTSIVDRPCDIIKLDMMFARHIGIEKKMEILVNAAIETAHYLGVKVVAEGVETKEQYEFLKEHGCDYIQGFYFSKPLPEDEFEKLLAGDFNGNTVCESNQSVEQVKENRKTGKEKHRSHAINITNALIQSLNNTSLRMFMYYPQTKTMTVPEKTCDVYQWKTFYTNMPYSFIEHFVYEGDYDVFREMFYKIDRGEITATATFHSKDLGYCIQVTLTTVTWTENGQPDDVLGLIEDKSDLYQNEKLVNQLKEELLTQDMNAEFDDALKTMASSIGSQYYGVYYIWLGNHTYVCFQEQLNGLLSVIGEKGVYEAAWEKYIEGYIEDKDKAGLRKFMEITTLEERIGQKSSISFDYRRKGIGWSRGQFIAGKRDENGKLLTVIYTVSDINEEIETKRKMDEAEQEALRDPMTKLWNRKAFEQFKESNDYAKDVAFVLFDIDRFKAINDQFGHDVGDQVIIAMGNVVRGVLRQKDLVFRMGGDEFALLLYNCDDSVWNTICRKIETIHTDIKSMFPPELNATLSVGICVNKDGYCDEMYKLADQALYNTKANGRGGCSFINLDGEIVNEWHDNSGCLRKGDVLEKNSTVTWRLDKPKKAELPYRIYGDELFYALVGLDRTATPEELYQAWRAGYDADNSELIKKATKLAVTDGKAEVVFEWKHPEKGVIKLRCSGSFESETDDYYTFIGYIHVITGIHVITKEDIEVKVKNALEEMYFSNYYVRLSDYSFKAYKVQPYMEETIQRYANAIEAIDSYVTYMVADEYKEIMAKFLDLTTIKQRMKNTNYIGMDYFDPNIGKARAKFVVVDRNDEGEAETVLFIVEAISAAN